MQVFQNKPITQAKPATEITSKGSGFPKTSNAEARAPSPTESSEAVEKPKNKGGRPRKHQVEAGQPRPTVAPFNSGRSSFPKPTNGVTQKKFTDFLKYWQSLTPAMCSRCRVHVYRKWPVIDRTLSGEKNQSIYIFQEDPSIGTKGSCHYDLNGWEQQVLHEFGSGDYKYLLNEIGVTGVIAMCDFVVVRDAMIPPKLNYDELNKGDKLNADYIASLRRQGVKLPGDVGYTSGEEKEEEMAQAQAQTIDKLTDKFMDLVERQQTHTPAPARSLDDVGAARSIEMVAKAADRAGEIVQTAQAQAAQLQGKQVDPLQMLTTLGGVVREMMPKSDGSNSLVALLMEQNAALNREMRDRDERRAAEEKEYRRREDERREREEERRNKADAERAAAEKPKSLVEQVRELKEMNEALGLKKGRSVGDSDEEEKDGKTDVLETVIKFAPMVVTGLTTLFSLGANIYYNSKLKPGEAPQPVPTEGVQHVQQQMQQIANGVDAQKAAEEQQMLMFLQTIEGPFLSHFFNGELDGHTFANHIYTMHPMQGPMIYGQMQSAGKEHMIATLSRYPPIWNQISSMGTQLNQFADEFMEYQEWKAGIAAGEEDADEEKKEAVN